MIPDREGNNAFHHNCVYDVLLGERMENFFLQRNLETSLFVGFVVFQDDDC